MRDRAAEGWGTGPGRVEGRRLRAEGPALGGVGTREPRGRAWES